MKTISYDGFLSPDMPEDIKKIRSFYRDWFYYLSRMNQFGEIASGQPVSVIARARDVATYALLAFLNIPKEKAIDLGDLVKILKNKEVAPSN